MTLVHYPHNLTLSKVMIEPNDFSSSCFYSKVHGWR